MIYLESTYKHQAIVFRRFSDTDGITVRKMLENLGLRNIKLISSDLDTNIFEIVNTSNPEARAIFVQYINPENQKPYTVSLYFQPIEKTDQTLYIRVTYTKPGDVLDDRKTVFSKSEPMVVSFMVVYDYQRADSMSIALAQLSASIDQKLEKGDGELTKDDFEFIHGCYELDRLEQYMNDGQFYHARYRFNDALLMFRRVLGMLSPEISASSDEKDRLQYALVCMYIAKSYEQKGILSKAMYYINLAKSMDYIYETDADLMRDQYDKDTDIASEINIGYILNTTIDADLNCLDPVLANTHIEHGKTTVVKYQRPEGDKDKSLISNNSAIIINSNLVTDTEGADIIRIDITLPHFAHDNDKFADEKYNIPDNATFVLSANYNPNPDLKAENMDQIIAEAENLTKQKFYLEALIRLEFAVQKLKQTYTRADRKANYIKALQLISECTNRLALNEKAVFYASELKALSPDDCGPLYAHCLIDANDPRTLKEVNGCQEKTAKMQLFLKRKEEEEKE